MADPSTGTSTNPAQYAQMIKTHLQKGAAAQQEASRVSRAFPYYVSYLKDNPPPGFEVKKVKAVRTNGHAYEKRELGFSKALRAKLSERCAGAPFVEIENILNALLPLVFGLYKGNESTVVELAQQYQKNVQKIFPETKASFKKLSQEVEKAKLILERIERYYSRYAPAYRKSIHAFYVLDKIIGDMTQLMPQATISSRQRERASSEPKLPSHRVPQLSQVFFSQRRSRLPAAKKPPEKVTVSERRKAASSDNDTAIPTSSPATFITPELAWS